jgi:hypothetical protein
MGRQDLSAVIRADWIFRFATQMLELAPQMKPLDAVRSAMSAAEFAREHDPHDAARRVAQDNRPKRVRF